MLTQRQGEALRPLGTSFCYPTGSRLNIPSSGTQGTLPLSMLEVQCCAGVCPSTARTEALGSSLERQSCSQRLGSKMTTMLSVMATFRPDLTFLCLRLPVA